MDCIFCKIVAGEIPGQFVYQDDEVMVIKDIYPQAPVHLLVIPKKHVEEFVAADAALVGKIFATVKKIIEQEKVSNYRLVSNGKGASIIDHLHVHMLGSVDKKRKL